MVDAPSELSGASFTRLSTASFLAYLFDGVALRDDSRSAGPDYYWMRYAVRLERGDLTIDDIANDMFESQLETTRTLIRQREVREASDPSDFNRRRIEEMRDDVKELLQRQQYWQNNVTDFGGQRQAIMHLLEKGAIRTNK